MPRNLQDLNQISTSPLVSDKRKRRSLIPTAQFNALEDMPLDRICVWSDAMPEFKEMAKKFFTVKYRHLKLSTLANPITGTFSLHKVERTLRLFGDLIWTLVMDVEMLDEKDSVADLLALVRNHCSETLGWMSI